MYDDTGKKEGPKIQDIAWKFFYIDEEKEILYGMQEEVLYNQHIYVNDGRWGTKYEIMCVDIKTGAGEYIYSAKNYIVGMIVQQPLF